MRRFPMEGRIFLSPDSNLRSNIDCSESTRLYSRPKTNAKAHNNAMPPLRTSSAARPGRRKRYSVRRYKSTDKGRAENPVGPCVPSCRGTRLAVVDSSRRVGRDQSTEDRQHQHHVQMGNGRSWGRRSRLFPCDSNEKAIKTGFR